MGPKKRREEHVTEDRFMLNAAKGPGRSLSLVSLINPKFLVSWDYFT